MQDTIDKIVYRKLKQMELNRSRKRRRKRDKEEKNEGRGREVDGRCCCDGEGKAQKVNKLNLRADGVSTERARNVMQVARNYSP